MLPIETVVTTVLHTTCTFLILALSLHFAFFFFYVLWPVCVRKTFCGFRICDA